MADSSDTTVPASWRDNLPAPADIARTAREFDVADLSSSQVVGLAVGAATVLGVLVAALGPAQAEPTPRAARLKPAKGDRRALVAVVEGKKLDAKTKRGLRQQAEQLQSELDKADTLVEKQRKERGVIAAEDVPVSITGKEEEAMSNEPIAAVLKNGKLTRRSRKELHQHVKEIQKDIQRVDKAVQKQARRVQRQAAFEDARDTASNVGENIGKQLAAVGATAAAAVTPLLDKARNSDLPDQVRDTAKQATKATRQSVRGFADTARDRSGDLSDRVRDTSSDLSEKVREDVLPAIGSKASKLSEFVQEVVPQVANYLREDVLPQVSEVVNKAGASVSDMASSGVDSSRDAAKKLAQADFAKEVNKQTYRGRKQAASALSSLAAQLEPPKQRNYNGLWVFAIVAAITGLFAYLLQDEERRNKLVNSTQSMLEQGREIVRDFQGYDEEF